MTDKLAAAEESQWRNLETQTGKSKAQWLKLATAKKLASRRTELVKTDTAWTMGCKLIAIRSTRDTAAAPRHRRTRDGAIRRRRLPEPTTTTSSW